MSQGVFAVHLEHVVHGAVPSPGENKPANKLGPSPGTQKGELLCFFVYFYRNRNNINWFNFLTSVSLQYSTGWLHGGCLMVGPQLCKCVFAYHWLSNTSVNLHGQVYTIQSNRECQGLIGGWVNSKHAVLIIIFPLIQVVSFLRLLCGLGSSLWHGALWLPPQW